MVDSEGRGHSGRPLKNVQSLGRRKGWPSGEERRLEDSTMCIFESSEQAVGVNLEKRVCLQTVVGFIYRLRNL